ncbi:hypothetical protein HY496_00990 [Candidatus Woesearchaeota archaeon]|nr:hypothetical protein [Candidatus Woesearchaeota archaeon]
MKKMAIDFFVKKEIGEAVYLGILGTARHREPRYVLGLETMSSSGSEVYFYPEYSLEHSSADLSAQEAIRLYLLIKSTEEFEKTIKKERGE